MREILRTILTGLLLGAVAALVGGGSVLFTIWLTQPNEALRGSIFDDAPVVASTDRLWV